ncbi:hypothetical protein TNCV_325391 [Trichonephila clavipes]|nr:hypothetical protein TNCV_325391 [Trichonephila clavipes]
MALRNKGGVTSKRFRCRSRNVAPEDFIRVRECICVLRTNRTKKDESRLLWPINDKGRAACCGPSLLFRRVIFMKRGETWTYLERPGEERKFWRAETSRDRIWNPKEIFSLRKVRP